MRPIALQTLTWATVAAAVVSALWLAAVEAETGHAGRLSAPTAALLPLVWPSEPSAARPAASRRSDDRSSQRRPRPAR